tara:strand:+ start:655 stop:954 length:300 start_codon:yes stop_codon:yes gene_type:complete
MNSFLIFILGTILLNSIFSLIPIFWVDSDPGAYMPYQFWFNLILLFMWLLPSTKADYLFDKPIEQPKTKASTDLDAPPATPPTAPSTEPEPRLPLELSK